MFPRNGSARPSLLRQQLRALTLSFDLDLTVSLGNPRAIAEQAVALTSKDAMSASVQPLPEWQGLALMLLADGESISQIQQALWIMNRPMSLEEAATLFVEPEPVGDQELLDNFDPPSAQMGFAKLAGAEELRRVITCGDFYAWRVFLYPQQRTWVRCNWGRPRGLPLTAHQHPAPTCL